MADSLNITQDALLTCVCDGLATAGRPVCDCYSVVGDPMVAICCECDTGVSGEATIHFNELYEVDQNTFEEIVRVRPCRGGTLAADFTVNVSRCYPTIQEDGSFPSPEDQEAAAKELNEDVATIYRALSCCTGLRLAVRGVSVESSPQAGCALLTALVTVEVSP